MTQTKRQSRFVRTKLIFFTCTKWLWGGIYNIILVDSGKECVERYIAEKNNEKKIHILLLDYKLGDMLDNIVACKISQVNGVKTILISAHDLNEKMANDLQRRHCIRWT